MWTTHVSATGRTFYARDTAPARWDEPGSDAARMYDCVAPAATVNKAVVDCRHANNEAKRDLIERGAPSTATAVLDLCCGQGGDLRKFAKSLPGLRRYAGYDASERCVREAQRRIVAGALGDRVAATVERRDLLCADSWKDLCRGEWDVVSMQMAIHYFAEDRALLRQLLRCVAAALRPGGTFVVSMVDAAMLQDAAFLRTCEDLFRVERRPEDPDNAYRFSLEGSVGSEARVPAPTRHAGDRRRRRRSAVSLPHRPAGPHDSTSASFSSGQEEENGC